MESLDYWRLCDELTVIQAALLIVGCDPAQYDNIESWAPDSQPTGYLAAKSALLTAISAKELSGDKRDAWADEESYRQLDILLKVTNLKRWLLSRGISTGFFFPKIVENKPGYLDAQHPNYSPKLAAAIEAWVAVTEAEEKTKGKTIKKSIEIWLRANAGHFGLIKANGNPNETGIEEVIKVANWGTKGGAPKTP